MDSPSVNRSAMRKDHHITLKVVEAKGFTKGEEVEAFVVIRKYDTAKGSTEQLTEDNQSTKSRATTKSKSTHKTAASSIAHNQGAGSSERDVVGKTKVSAKSKTPWFDDSFDIDLSDDFKELSVEVWQQGLLTKKMLGQVIIQKVSLELNYRLNEDWYTLRQPDMAAEDVEEKRIEKAHDFQSFMFTSPHTCDKCKQLLWSGSKTGVKCTICNSVGHEQCVAQIGNTCGSAGLIRLKYMYTEEYLLPIAAYGNLVQLMTDSKFNVSKCLGRVVTEDREEVAKTIITVFNESGQAVNFLKAVISTEIQNTSDANTIFRANSIGSKAIDSFMKLVAMKYLKGCIGPVVQEILIQNRICELDPTRIDMKDKELVEEAFTVLEAYVKWALDVILRSGKDCPYQLKQVFAHLRKEAQTKFPEDKVVGNTVVTAFIFLRLFNAAILNPQLFGLSPDNDPPNARNARTLTLISKTIQQLANMLPFNEKKEPFMVKLNHLVSGQYITNLTKYLNDICTPPSDAEIEKIRKKKEANGNKTLSRLGSFFGGSSNKVGGEVKPVDLERELAALHRHLMRNMEKMAGDAALSADERKDLVKLQVILNEMLEQYLKKAKLIQMEREQEMKLLQNAVTVDGSESMSMVSSVHTGSDTVRSSIFVASALDRTNQLLGVENKTIKEMARLELAGKAPLMTEPPQPQAN